MMSADTRTPRACWICWDSLYCTSVALSAVLPQLLLSKERSYWVTTTVRRPSRKISIRKEHYISTKLYTRAQTTETKLSHSGNTPSQKSMSLVWNRRWREHYENERVLRYIKLWSRKLNVWTEPIASSCTTKGEDHRGWGPPRIRWQRMRREFHQFHWVSAIRSFITSRTVWEG